jgi:hypothetical protein
LGRLLRVKGDKQEIVLFVSVGERAFAGWRNAILPPLEEVFGFVNQGWSQLGLFGL